MCFDLFSSFINLLRRGPEDSGSLWGVGWGDVPPAIFHTPPLPEEQKTTFKKDSNMKVNMKFVVISLILT